MEKSPQNNIITKQLVKNPSSRNEQKKMSIMGKSSEEIAKMRLSTQRQHDHKILTAVFFQITRYKSYKNNPATKKAISLLANINTRASGNSRILDILFPLNPPQKSSFKWTVNNILQNEELRNKIAQSIVMLTKKIEGKGPYSLRILNSNNDKITVVLKSPDTESVFALWNKSKLNEKDKYIVLKGSSDDKKPERKNTGKRILLQGEELMNWLNNGNKLEESLIIIERIIPDLDQITKHFGRNVSEINWIYRNLALAIKKPRETKLMLKKMEKIIAKIKKRLKKKGSPYFSLSSSDHTKVDNLMRALDDITMYIDLKMVVMMPYKQ